MVDMWTLACETQERLRFALPGVDLDTYDKPIPGFFLTEKGVERKTAEAKVRMPSGCVLLCGAGVWWFSGCGFSSCCVRLCRQRFYKFVLKKTGGKKLFAKDVAKYAKSKDIADLVKYYKKISEALPASVEGTWVRWPRACLHSRALFSSVPFVGMCAAACLMAFFVRPGPRLQLRFALVR